MKAHLFNPENDMALVSNRASYTPPIAIQRFKHALQELPRWWADEGDIIITSDTKSVPAEAEPAPWGWSQSAITTFRNLGCKGPFPDVEMIRRLSHRRTAAKLNGALEVTDPAQISGTNIFLKAPWSCSGRGVTDCSKMTLEATRALAAKIIRSQGSVMVEPKLPKTQDFALLFEAKNGEVEFVGISCFYTGNGTNYSGNLCASQEELVALIPAESIPLIQNQLKSIVPAEYTGSIGVDMIANGAEFYPVEINWRRTMGFVAMDLYNQLGRGIFSIQPCEHEGIQLVPANPYFSATFTPQP